MNILLKVEGCVENCEKKNEKEGKISCLIASEKTEERGKIVKTRMSRNSIFSLQFSLPLPS